MEIHGPVISMDKLETLLQRPILIAFDNKTSKRLLYVPFTATYHIYRAENTLIFSSLNAAVAAYNEGCEIAS
jgi:hypothetical protein